MITEVTFLLILYIRHVECLLQRVYQLQWQVQHTRQVHVQSDGPFHYKVNVFGNITLAVE